MYDSCPCLIPRVDISLSWDVPQVTDVHFSWLGLCTIYWGTVETVFLYSFESDSFKPPHQYFIQYVTSPIENTFHNHIKLINWLSQCWASCANIRPCCDSAPKLQMYACHDSSIVLLLSMFNCFNHHWPPYSANIRLELYEAPGCPDRYWMKILYCNKVISHQLFYHSQPL